MFSIITLNYFQYTCLAVALLVETMRLPVPDTGPIFSKDCVLAWSKGAGESKKKKKWKIVENYYITNFLYEVRTVQTHLVKIVSFWKESYVFFNIIFMVPEQSASMR